MLAYYRPVAEGLTPKLLLPWVNPLVQLKERNRLRYTADFSFIFSSRTCRHLEETFAVALRIFCQLLKTLQLTQSPMKSQALIFNRPYLLDPDKPLVMSIHDVSLAHIQQLKILGIIIYSNIYWIPLHKLFKIKILKTKISITTKLT